MHVCNIPINKALYWDKPCCFSWRNTVKVHGCWLSHLFLPFLLLPWDHLAFLKHLSAILKWSKTKAYLNSFHFPTGLFCLLPAVCHWFASGGVMEIISHYFSANVYACHEPVQTGRQNWRGLGHNGAFYPFLQFCWF